MLPNFVLGGAPKCGTSSVFGWLADHPQACGAAVKEPFYLMDRGHSLLRPDANVHDHGIEGYGRFFAHCAGGADIVFEATTHYLYQQTALDVLAELPSRPKVAFILREPAQRLYSSYRYTKNNLALLDRRVTFARYLELIRDPDPHALDRVLARPSAVLKTEIEQGQYARYLRRWIERLGRPRVGVFLFESIRADSREFMRRLARWLEIDETFYDRYEFVAQNESLAIRNQTVHRWARRAARLLPLGRTKAVLKRGYLLLQNGDTATRSAEDDRALLELKASYEPYNRQLAELTGLDLSLWQSEATREPFSERSSDRR